MTAMTLKGTNHEQQWIGHDLTRNLRNLIAAEAKAGDRRSHVTVTLTNTL